MDRRYHHHLERVVLATCLAVLAAGYAGPASADGNAGWYSADYEEQTKPNGSSVTLPAGHKASDYSYQPTCSIGSEADCPGYDPCQGQDDTGIRYAEYYQGSATGSTYCAVDGWDEEGEVQITPAMVMREFVKYAWPASGLQVQPPNRRTAVNLPTFYFTDDTAAIVQDLPPLLGHDIVVEATPAAFTWTFGDGRTWTTTSPGGPYPAGDVVHCYRSKGPVSVRLDTTYTGRFRVDGGPWTGLPGTHTVNGAAQPLDVVEVRPTLVASGGTGYGGASSSYASSAYAPAPRTCPT